LPPFRPGPGAGPPRGHPASSGCVLDGTPAGFGPIDGRRTLARPAGRAPALFRLTGGPVDRYPLAPSCGRLVPVREPRVGSAVRFQSPDRGSPGARQCQRLSRDRGTFHRMGPLPSALARARRGDAAPAGRPEQLPRVFTAVRRHRLDLSSCRFRGTNRGRARPYDFCRWMSPRARPRTTRTSRSAKFAVGTTVWARLEVAFRSRQPPEVLRVRGRAPDARHSRSRLLAPETWPQPRSLRAPGVAGRHPPPVWSDAVRW
jgi:hypothetical protein